LSLQVRLKALLSLDQSKNVVLSILLNGEHLNIRVFVRLHEIKFFSETAELPGKKETDTKTNVLMIIIIIYELKLTKIT